jgi:osmotically-inducible protein OsmY
MPQIELMKTIDTTDTQDTHSGRIQRWEDEGGRVVSVPFNHPVSLTGAQSEDTAFAPVQKFCFGADIVANDGEAGRLVSVVTAAPNHQMPVLTHIGVRIHWYQHYVVFVSLDHIIAATAEAISVNLPRDEIEAQTEKPDGYLLSSSTSVSVQNEEGSSEEGRTSESSVLPGVRRLGHLTQLTITRKSRTLRHVVVAGRSGKKVLVPANLITGLTARQLILRLHDGSAEQKDQLVPYRSDESLRQEVYDKLFDYEPMRLDLPAIDIEPIDGTVWLRGHISSDGMRRLAEETVQAITGLVALHNELVADDALAAAVSMALARDGRIAGTGQHIGVYPRLGTIRLRGSVQTPAAREIASAIAATVSMVGPVLNELHIAATAETLSELAGVTNQYDLVPGGR